VVTPAFRRGASETRARARALDRLIEVLDRVHSRAVRHFALTSHPVFEWFPSPNDCVIARSSMTSLTIPLCSTVDRQRFRETDCGKNQAGRLDDAGDSMWL